MANSENPSLALGQKMQDELQEIDQMISYVILEHDQLAKATRAVIPNEEPHVIVLDGILDWLRVARAARIGDLRYRRDQISPFTNQQIEEISLDDYMLETPVDMESLLRKRLDSIVKEEPQYVEPSNFISAFEEPEEDVVSDSGTKASVVNLSMPSWASVVGVAAAVSLIVSLLASIIR